jgi:uncharacterized radical SAM superfamily Fe-S cluster-containing enzyme
MAKITKATKVTDSSKSKYSLCPVCHRNGVSKIQLQVEDKGKVIETVGYIMVCKYCKHVIKEVRYTDTIY